LIARIDIRQEIRRQEIRLDTCFTTEEGREAWEELAKLLKLHDKLEIQARHTNTTLSIVEYEDDTIVYQTKWQNY
jgi:hypothetical protein